MSETAPQPVAREWEPRQINPDGDGEIFVSGTDEMIPWTKLWPEHNALVARLREVEAELDHAVATIEDRLAANEALRAQLAAAVEHVDAVLGSKRT